MARTKQRSKKPFLGRKKILRRRHEKTDLLATPMVQDSVKLVTCMSTESDSDSDSKLLRNTLKGCQTFQNNTEERNVFPITIISSKNTP